jgi:serine/threonine protein phosphatase PrpC
MKEQVSVDESFVEKVEDELCSSGLWDCVDPIELCEIIINIFIAENPEMQRLKRLDEIFKRKITQCIGGKLGHYYLVNIELLESLDK